MIRNVPRGRLWKLTLLIWIGGGVFVFHRCSVEAVAVRKQALSHIHAMEIVYSRNARLIKADPRKKPVKKRMAEVAMAHAEYLKNIRKLKKRLFWKDLYKQDDVAAALGKMGNARKSYLQALRQRRGK